MNSFDFLAALVVTGHILQHNNRVPVAFFLLPLSVCVCLCVCVARVFHCVLKTIAVCRIVSHIR